MLLRLSTRSVCAGLLVLWANACGARTNLLLPEACPTEGRERLCQNACGEGRQTCTDGVWSDCAVESTSRSCSTKCGGGSQTCTDGAWSECEVPVATRACSDPCGEGTESCRDGRWEACEVQPVKRNCSSVCGSGFETCQKGKWGTCDAPQPRPPQLRSIVRDFSPETHPDFEANYPSGIDVGIVKDELGPDDKPQYAGLTDSTSGAPNFDMWFRDTPGINQSKLIPLPLTPAADDPGFFEFVEQRFFPIDNQLLGNEGNLHNFHFTLEASTTFEYRGGETFSFSGDDDMWVFINRRLAIDLGGIHVSLSAEVALDEFAKRGGLVRGEVYPLHFFFAERHTVESHFTIRTSIAEPGSCD